jgi:L-alanine-DL-glutamate epimerase-like enolase superfamily enzyme
MAIRSVTAHALSLPYDLGGPKPIFAGKERLMEMLLIRVETDEGLVGWGESFGFAIWPSTVQVIERLIAPMLIQQDESNLSQIHLDLSRKLHPLGRAGPVTFAISGVDIALWDIAGKKQNKSIAQMLGGARRQKIKSYASLIRYNNPELVAIQAKKAVLQGFNAIKIHEITVEAIQATRQAIGPDILLMVDANCPWNKEQALEKCEQLKSLNLYWLEEPLWPPEDHQGLAEIQLRGGIQTAAGENALGYQDFESLMKSKAINFAQPSITKIGGISEFLKIADLIAQSDMELAPHSPYMGPGLVATAQILSSINDEAWLEYTFCDMPVNPLGSSVLTHQGDFLISSKPGLGFDVDESIVKTLKIV